MFVVNVAFGVAIDVVTTESKIGYFSIKVTVKVKVIDLGIILKNVISWVCMPNMMSLSLTVQKLWPKLIFFATESQRTDRTLDTPKFHSGGIYILNAPSWRKVCSRSVRLLGAFKTSESLRVVEQFVNGPFVSSELSKLLTALRGRNFDRFKIADEG